MAVAPTSADVSQTGLRVTRDITQVPESAGLRAIEGGAAATRSLVENLADAENQIRVSRADVGAAQDLEAIRQKYELDDDWQTAPDRAHAEAVAALEARGRTVRGHTSQQAWAVRSQERLVQFQGTMRQQSRQRGVSITRGQLIQFGDEAMETAGDLTNSEDVRTTAAANYAGALQDAEDRGLLDPDQSAELESRFTAGVRQRVVQGLEGEYTSRLDIDPGALAEEIKSGAGQWGLVPQDTRAQWVASAQRADGAQAVNLAIERTLRTGEVTSEEALAPHWAHLPDGARMAYVERASNALTTHRAAEALGSLAGKSLTEIAAMADRAREANLDPGGGGGSDAFLGPAARAHLQAARRDPASYVVSTQPHLQALQAAARQANAAVRQANPGSDAQSNATEANYAYGLALIQAQDALGLPPSQQHLYTPEQLQVWARRVRSLPPAQQAAQIEALPEQLSVYWGDQHLADRALADHLQVYGNTESLPSDAPVAHPADNAGQGASYDAVRASVIRLLGVPGSDQQVRRIVNTLSPADRNRLAADPEVVRATRGGQ